MKESDLPLLVGAGEAAFERRDWTAAYQSLSRAGADGVLDAEGWDLLGEAAWWLGEIDDALTAWERAYDCHLGDRRRRSAALSAMYVAYHSIERGDVAKGSGWVSRMTRLLDDEPEGSEHGYPLYFRLFELSSDGNIDGAMTLAARMQELGHRFDDPNLVAVGLMGEGRMLIKQGHVEDGMPLLDEAMLAALSDQLHPVWTGAIYCHLMDVCHELSELRRAGEWTHAAATWCEDLPPNALYRGICRVHRAQVLRRQGAWEQAEEEADRACRDVAHLHPGTVAEGHYELGEIRRLRGDLDGAESSYRRAHELGRDPQPGLALLRMMQDQVDVAATSIASALEARRGDPLGRAQLLAGQCEIALASGDVDTARAAATELGQTAQEYQSSGLEAAARQADGAVWVHDGKVQEAVGTLRSACRLWQEMDAQYSAARTRLLLSKAHRELGDDDGARLELDAAENTFRRLGATPALAELEELQGKSSLPAGLTDRQGEVLELVATGASNSEIGTSLFISKRTVDRHVSDIFTKLGVSSRTEATAWAFEHGLVPRRG